MFTSDPQTVNSSWPQLVLCVRILQLFVEPDAIPFSGSWASQGSELDRPRLKSAKETEEGTFSVDSSGNSCWWKELLKNSGQQESTHWMKKCADWVRWITGKLRTKTKGGLKHPIWRIHHLLFQGEEFAVECGLHDMKRRAPVNCFRWTIHSIDSICSNMVLYMPVLSFIISYEGEAVSPTI